jgi:hypothetical protein
MTFAQSDVIEVKTMNKFAGLTWGILGTSVVALSGVQARALQKQSATRFLSAPVNQKIRAGKIEVRATMNKRTFRASEPVHFTITATNTDDTARSLTFPTGQNFDITVFPTDRKKSPHWTWSHHMAFTMMVREVEIKPGQTLTFHATWNQQDDGGKIMPRGNYQVCSKLTSTNRGINAPIVNIDLIK